ncbi:MAG: TRAP transporter small permease [Desulfomonile tiedjei]|nr:TRAP transporter small permease [Desulfomonile tiedjei]
MQGFLRITRVSGNALNVMGAALLTLMMLLTALDVILRYLGRPITGTYELMSFAGALVTGFALAQTSLDGAHVNVDIITQSISDKKKRAVEIFNRLLGVGIFALLTWGLFEKGSDLYMTGEVSLTLQVPYYPVAFGLSFCCFVECLVLLSGISKAISGEEHE